MGHPDDESLFEQGVDQWNDAIKHRLDGDSTRDVKVRGRPARSLGNHVHRPGSRSIPPQSRLLSTSRLRFLRSPRHRLSYRVFGFDFRAASFCMANLRDANFTARSHRCFLHQHRPSRGGTARREAGQCPFLRGGSHRCRSIRHLALESQTVPARRPTQELPGPPSTTVSSVSDLIAVSASVTEASQPSGLRIYYRGEPRHWKLRPSVMRTASRRRREGRMSDLMTRRPGDFSEVSNALEQWVLAQTRSQDAPPRYHKQPSCRTLLRVPRQRRGRQTPRATAPLRCSAVSIQALQQRYRFNHC